MKEDPLFSLVRSLEKVEKRYFRLHQNLYKGSTESSSVQLFQALDKEASYDEQAFLKKHHTRKFTRHYRAEKKQLQDMLLASLTRMQAEKKLALQLRQRISAGELLVEKQQFELARKLLSKARQTAAEANCYEIALDALTVEVRLYTTPALMADLKTLYTERERLLDLIREEDQYASLIIDFFLLATRLNELKDPETAKRFDALKHHPMLQAASRARSPKAKVMFHHFWSNYYVVFPDLRLRYEHFTKEFDVVASNFLFARAWLSEAGAVTFNVLTTAYNFGDLRRIEEVKRFLEAFVPAVRKSAGKSVLVNLESLELFSFFYSNLLNGNFAAVATQRKKTLALSKALEQNRAPARLLLFSLGLAQFAVGDYRQCIRSLNTFLNNSPDVYTDALKQRSGFYLFLLCHYELGNADVIEQQAGNVVRQLKKEQHGLELLLMQFFLRIVGTSRKNAAREALALQRKLVKTANPADQILLQFISFFRVWLEALHSGKAFGEVWKQSVKVIR